jgi:hypothetical protein
MMKKRLVTLCTISIGGAGAVVAAWGFHGIGLSNQMEYRVLAPGGPKAFETEHATIITDSASKAKWADERLRDAVANFIRTFGVSPGRGLIVEMPYASYAKAIPKAQRRWTLPWMSQYFRSGDQASAGPGEHHFDNDSGIQHELNHVFFTAALVPSTRRFQYGGDAPDWLDEAVALAGESPKVKARRRVDFTDQVCAGRLVPLERFVVQQHPLFASPAMQKFIAQQRDAAKGAPVMATIGEKQLDLPQHALADFYAQSNAVAEFLAEDSGDPNVLGRIARSHQANLEQTDGRGEGWMAAYNKSGKQPLGARFAAWALASARASKPDCRARLSNG